MLRLAEFENYTYWAPRLDRHAQFGCIPLAQKELLWFERTRLRLQKFETCPI